VTRLVLPLLLLAAFAPSRAEAQWEPAGSVSASFHLGVDGSDAKGASLLVDLWQPLGIFRLGFAAGVGAISNGDPDVSVAGAETVSRAFAPLGLSLGFQGGGRVVGGSLILRVGAFGGADDDGDQGRLVGGFWAGGGASLDLYFDPRIAIRIGAEAWLLAGVGPTRVTVAPTLGLTWRWDGMPVPEPAPEEELDPARFREEPL